MLFAGLSLLLASSVAAVEPVAPSHPSGRRRRSSISTQDEPCAERTGGRRRGPLPRDGETEEVQGLREAGVGERRLPRDRRAQLQELLLGAPRGAVRHPCARSSRVHPSGTRSRRCSINSRGRGSSSARRANSANSEPQASRYSDRRHLLPPLPPPPPTSPAPSRSREHLSYGFQSLGFRYTLGPSRTSSTRCLHRICSGYLLQLIPSAFLASLACCQHPSAMSSFIYGHFTENLVFSTSARWWTPAR